MRKKTCDLWKYPVHAWHFFSIFFLHIKILIYISHVEKCRTMSNLQVKKQIPCDFVCHGLFLCMEILIHTWKKATQISTYGIYVWKCQFSSYMEKAHALNV